MTIHNDIGGFISLKPRYFKFLKSIKISRNLNDNSCCKCDIELILSKSSSFCSEELRLIFVNSFDIRVGWIDSVIGLLVDIEDVKNRQIEGGNYRVVEQEERMFSFYCEEFFIDLMS